MIAEWLLAPVLLAALFAGLGLGIARIAGAGLPGALAPACGMALAFVAGAILADLAHALIVPVLAGLALAGAVAGRRMIGRVDGAAAAVTLGAFGLYALPVVLSGEATFAGYIKLDDTATWLAVTDRVMDAGVSTDGLAASTYEAVLTTNFANGYPVGGFVPLGFAGEVLGEDLAWIFQPYLALTAAILALVLWELARDSVTRPGARAAVAIGASCSALLVGYYLWGGVKEIQTAALFAAVTAAAVRVPASDPRAVVAVAVLACGLVATGGAAALVWAAPASAIIGLRAAWSEPRVRLALGVGAAGVGVVGLGLVATGAGLSPFRVSFTNQEDLGNLAAPLEPAQVIGIWPAFDFRFDPYSDWIAYALMALAAALALHAVAVAVRSGRVALAGFAVGAVAVSAAVAVVASPWLDAKALAIASPAVLLAALAGATELPGPRTVRSAATVALLAGVGWSLVTQWGGASLAPRDQLAELERIGQLLEGAGPTLVTEYQPYGTRHFLRGAAPEGVSELRRRAVMLRTGSGAEKGEWADTDDLTLATLAPYRALVLRRSPEQSRPPGDFARTWAGDHYELWQREVTGSSPIAHLPLGGGRDPVGAPRCAAVRRLAREAGPNGKLVASEAPRPAVVLGSAGGRWTASGARLEIWVEGSVRGLARLELDGEPIAERRHVLNNEGGYIPFGTVDPTPGSHELRVELEGADLVPGSAPDGSTPQRVVLRREPSADAMRAVPAAAARRLCGREWDWIEAFSAR